MSFETFKKTFGLGNKKSQPKISHDDNLKRIGDVNEAKKWIDEKKSKDDFDVNLKDLKIR